MSSSQPYSFNDWFGILANPKDTINYLRRGRLPRNTDSVIVEDNPYPNPNTPDSNNFRKNFKGKGSTLWMVQNRYPDVHNPYQAYRNTQQVAPVFKPITTVQDNKPVVEKIRQQSPVRSNAQSFLKRETTPRRFVSTPRPTGNDYLDKAFAREAELRDEAAKNYSDMVRKGQAKINEYKREAGINKDNPEARKNVLEWQKRVQEEERQRALKSTKPTKELDPRYTQPPPSSALDKVNKIMKG